MQDDGLQIATNVVTFVDYACPSGPTKQEALLVARQTARTLGHLWIYDPPWKRRDSSPTPGAWAGLVIQTNNGEAATILVSEDKCTKTE
jgi:hypothetical protein